MLIETWVAVMIMVFLFILAFIGLSGWSAEGKKYSHQVEENKKLRRYNKRLENKIIYYNALKNIDEANKFYEEKKKK